MNEKEQAINEYMQNLPDIFKGSYKKDYRIAMSGKSMKKAIKMKCLDCCCWVVKEVKLCSVITCPLYAYRPYR